MSSAANLLASVIRPEILGLTSYHVPDSSGFIKLDAMENPYLVPETLRDEIASLVASAHINRYPDPNPAGLKAMIRQTLNLPPGMEILLGNGSDELIQLLAMAVKNPVLLSVEPSFVMYKMISTFIGLRYVGVPLAADFSLDLPATLAAIREHQPSLVFLAYPNNPTGNLFDRADVLQIIAASPGLVVIDEAYYAFASDSFMGDLADHPNLLVMRTFSKLGMAGLRLGYIAGSACWLDQLEKLRLPYNVGVLPQLVAQKLLEHHSVLLAQADTIKQDRAALYARMSKMAGVTVYPSEANFLLFRVKDSEAVFAGLKSRGVLIKKLAGGMLEGCLRVTVGAPDENERFIAALGESLAASCCAG